MVRENRIAPCLKLGYIQIGSIKFYFKLGFETLLIFINYIIKIIIKLVGIVLWLSLEGFIKISREDTLFHHGCRMTCTEFHQAKHENYNYFSIVRIIYGCLYDLQVPVNLSWHRFCYSRSSYIVLYETWNQFHKRQQFI